MCGLILCGVCSAHFQKFVYWVGAMFVHVMCTQCIVVWLQRMYIWDFVFMYWLHKAHCQLLPGPGFCSTSPLRSSRAASQPAWGRRLSAQKMANLGITMALYFVSQIFIYIGLFPEFYHIVTDNFIRLWEEKVIKEV